MSAASSVTDASAHRPRQRLGSVGDSVPASDSSEGTGSETFDMLPHWAMMDEHNNHHISSSSGHHHEEDHRLSSHHHHHGSSTAGSEHLADVTLDSLSLENSGVLSEVERGQVESFFSGLGTEIYVCPSLANLYESCGQNDWRLIFTGVPVLLHDKGSTRSRTLPRVTLVLAERGSCFALWQDTIDHLSDYKIGGPAFHTMCLSTDHTKVIGFSYDSNQAARETWQTIERLISDPANISLSVPGRKRKQPKRPKPAPLPPKSQISAPCQFQHVTSVTPDDVPRYFSLQAFVASPAKHRSH